MIISHKEFQSQITGAIAWDTLRQNGGQIEKSLWQMFAFDDTGVHYLSTECWGLSDRPWLENPYSPSALLPAKTG